MTLKYPLRFLGQQDTAQGIWGVDITPQSKAGKRVLAIREGCTGAPDCRLELRIEEGVESTEIHLTSEEAKALIKWAKKLRKRNPND